MKLLDTLRACAAAALLQAVCDAQVDQAWVAKPGGDEGVSVVADASGIYATGTTLNDEAHAFRWKILTVKYDLAGNEIWKHELLSPLGIGFELVPRRIALDPAGNVLVTGRHYVDMLTVKYAPDGTLLWMRLHEGAWTGVRVASDAAGNVYVVGPSSNVPSARDYVTVKYDSQGNELWTRVYDGPNRFDDAPAGLAVTAAGDVAVTGQSTGGPTGFDFATVRYAADGGLVWVRRYNHAPESGNDYGRDVAFGPDGEVYVVGASAGDGTGLDVALVAYDAAGVERWVVRYDGPASGADEGRRVAVDPAGDVVIAAEARQVDHVPAFVTAKHSPDGAQLWLATHSSGGGFADVPHALALGPDGAVYVAGDGGLGSQDYLTVAYDSAGALSWAAHYVDPDPLTDAARSLALCPGGEVAVAGGFPFTVVLYVQGVPSSEVVRAGLPPNPAALLPGATSGPVLGATWDPRIDHALLPPGAPAGADVLGVAWGPLSPGLPLGPAGTLLCDPSTAVGFATAPPGAPFQVAIPDVLALAGLALSAQGAAVEASGGLALTNALDLILGTY